MTDKKFMNINELNPIKGKKYIFKIMENIGNPIEDRIGIFIDNMCSSRDYYFVKINDINGNIIDIYYGFEAGKLYLKELA